MTALDCEKTKALLPLYIEHELSEEMELIKKHLENCPECQKDYTFFTSMLESLSSLPEPELPGDFHANLMRKVKATSPIKKTYFIDFKRIAGFAAAAAVIALSVVSFMNLEKTNEQSKNPDVYLTAPAQEETQTPQAEEIKTPKAKVEPMAPRKTSGPKTTIDGREVQGEASGFSRVREVPESQVSDVHAETSAAPALEQTEEISAYTIEETFTLATVSVSEAEKENAEAILSNFSKGDQGYLVGKDLELTLEKLAALEGYTVTTQESTTLKGHTIFLK